MSVSSGHLFSATDIDKAFPGVQALSRVSFSLRAGEIHALVGENGAGKSTLTKIMGGVEIADGGEMQLLDHSYAPSSRGDAEAHGVRMIMQELNLIGNLTVAENILLERMPRRLGFIRYKQLCQAASEAMAQIGLHGVDPAMPVNRLGTGQQQMVEIAAGLSRSFRVLILDEPTASLTDSEVDLLFTQLERLRREGVGIVYISHRLDEVLRISDRITVLRDGAVVAVETATEINTDGLIRQMVGRNLAQIQFDPPGEPGPVALRVEGLRRGAKVRDVSFEARHGEILGVAGLMGSGRTETMRAIFGADRPEEGAVYLRGSNTPARIRQPRDAVRQGLALLTEDRKEQGLFLALPVRVNISITRLRELCRAGWIKLAEERDVAQRHVDSLRIRCSSTEQIAVQLSGGNQQKLVIAKWLYRNCDILIFDEPTRGIDVGAKFEVYRMLNELARNGEAIIFVTSGLDELMAVCDRILVMSGGKAAGEFDRRAMDEERIMAAAFSEHGAMRMRNREQRLS